MKTPEEIREEIRQVVKDREELEKKHRRLIIELGQAMNTTQKKPSITVLASYHS